MKKVISLFAFTLVVSLLTSAVYAQTADEIVLKYYKAVGGIDKWKNLHTMKQVGTTAMMGMNFPTTVLTMRDNKQKVIATVQGKEVIDSYDGVVAWTINPFMGSVEPTKKSEEEAKQSAKQSFEDDLVDYASKGSKISFEGAEEIEGAKTLKVKLTRKDGDDVIYFFDADAYLPIMVRTFAASGPMKGQAVDALLSDYKEVDGMMMAHAMEQKVGGQTFMQFTAEKIELNPDIDPAIFSFPSK